MADTSPTPNILARILGANYKTTLTAIGTGIFAAITFLAGLSYDVSPMAMLFPPEWKPFVIKLSGACALLLWFWNGILQKSKEVSGGSVMQDKEGNVAKPQPKIPEEPKAALPRT